MRFAKAGKQLTGERRGLARRAQALLNLHDHAIDSRDGDPEPVSLPDPENPMKRLAPLLGLLLATQAVAVMPHASAALQTESGEAGTAAAIHVIPTTRYSSRITRYKVSTPSLEMSAKVPLRVNVILPTGYASHPTRRYPVLYALPGTSNLADVWLRYLDTVNLTKSLPMIVVIPDGTFDADGGGFYTNWVDKRTSRRCRELGDVPRARAGEVDRSALPHACQAFEPWIVGISQGGFGALSYAARHPQTYGAAALFSGVTSIYYNPICQVGAALLVSTIMTGLNSAQPFAPFGDPVTNAANWKSRDPASIVKNLSGTNVEIYTSSGKPSKEELLTDPAVLGTVGLEALLHVSNKCFKQAADKAGIKYGWHEYRVGTHAWMYGDPFSQGLSAAAGDVLREG